MGAAGPVQGLLGSSLAGDEHASRGSTFSLIYLLALIALIVQKPFLIYLLAPRAYRALWVLILLGLTADALWRWWGGLEVFRRPNDGLIIHLRFGAWTVILVCLSMLLHRSPDIIASARLILVLGQFLAVYYLVCRLERTIDIVMVLYRLAAVLSLLELGYILSRVAGLILPSFAVEIGLTGTYAFYPPFGFTYVDAETFVLPSLMQYRAYSYFIEPAKFASYLGPFFIISIYRWRATRRPAEAAMLASILAGLLLTASLAAAAALVLTWLVAMSIRRPWIALAAITTVVVSIPMAERFLAADSPVSEVGYLARRLASVDDRVAQYQLFGTSLVSNPLGEGWSEEMSSSEIRSRLTMRIDEVGVVSVVLMYLMAFGILALIPILGYFVAVGGAVARVLRRARDSPAAPLALGTVYLVCISFSIDLVMSPFYYLICTAFFRSTSAVTGEAWAVSSGTKPADRTTSRGE